MRGKLLSFIIMLLIVTFLCAQCTAMELVTSIGLLSSVSTLEQFIEVIYAHTFKGPERTNNALLIVNNMNNNVQYLLEDILKALQEQPNVFDNINNRSKLQNHIKNIGFVFEEAVRMQEDIDNHKREKKSSYIKFRRDYEHAIDKDFNEIKGSLLDGSKSFITKNFREGLRLYKNLCKTQRSHLQLLDSMLTQFNTVTSMYYITKNKMYGFVRHYRKNYGAFDTTRTNLRLLLRETYNYVVTEFKKIMANASRELWKCDGPKTNRYENKPDGSYYELMAFTKYITNTELYYGKFAQCSNLECEHFNNTMVNECQPDHDQFGWCSKIRKCPRELIFCGDLYENRNKKAFLFINNKEDANAYNRYTSFIHIDEYIGRSLNSQYHYKSYGSPVSPKDILNFGIPGGNDLERSPNYCKFCQCICRENIYYISTDSWGISDGYNNSMVVTGARIVVEDNTIYIQVQQGQLLDEGKINASSIQWQKIKKDGPKEEISWDGVRSIDLTTTMLPHDEIVTGMQFKLSPINKERIYLHLYSCKFYFPKSTLHDCREQPYKKSPQKQLNLDSADEPSKFIGSHMPDSKEDQYVTFTLTHMEKDAGQTTIPFIDTQIITTNPPSPLGGAGMHHRGTKDSGGFLALKLYTYDLVKYINGRYFYSESGRLI